MSTFNAIEFILFSLITLTSVYKLFGWSFGSFALGGLFFMVALGGTAKMFATVLVVLFSFVAYGLGGFA